MIRRIVGKAVMGILKTDVLQAAGPLQLCSEHKAEAEAAVHAMRAVFEDDNTDGIFFVDAANAFNNLNRKVALFNIRYVCAPISTILINCYRTNAHLYVGGLTLYCERGTTQGDSLAMAMFALATVSLIHSVAISGATQAWFADDAASGGKLSKLRQWWDALSVVGPRYRYYPNAMKTYLLVKPDQLAEAQHIFLALVF